MVTTPMYKGGFRRNPLFGSSVEAPFKFPSIRRSHSEVELVVLVVPSIWHMSGASFWNQKIGVWV